MPRGLFTFMLLPLQVIDYYRERVYKIAADQPQEDVAGQIRSVLAKAQAAPAAASGASSSS